MIAIPRAPIESTPPATDSPIPPLAESSPPPAPYHRKSLQPVLDALHSASTGLDDMLTALDLSKEETEALLASNKYQSHRQLRAKLLQEQLQIAAQGHAHFAMQKLLTIADSNHPAIARLAATQILTYAGLTPPKPVQPVLPEVQGINPEPPPSPCYPVTKSPCHTPPNTSQIYSDMSIPTQPLATAQLPHSPAPFFLQPAAPFIPPLSFPLLSPPSIEPQTVASLFATSYHAPMSIASPPPVSVIAQAAPARWRSPWGLAARRFLRNRLAVVGGLLLALLFVACFASLPWTLGTAGGQSAKGGGGEGIPRYADQMKLAHVKEAPSMGGGGGWGGLWMGTDSLGRDLRARFLLGGAISLSIGLASALIAVVIGTGVGMVAGYAGGRVDAVLMRGVDLLYGLPYILLVILMRVALVPWGTEFLKSVKGLGGKALLTGEQAGQWANILVLLVGIGSVSWLTMARVVRGQVMSLRDQPFVEAARALGFGGRRILIKHLLPNLVGTIVVYGTLTVPAAILSESFLSFLGLGVTEPLPSWGNLAYAGTEALNPVHVRWWLIAWPCAGLSVALLCLNFVGDGVRDALDPRG